MGAGELFCCLSTGQPRRECLHRHRPGIIKPLQHIDTVVSEVAFLFLRLHPFGNGNNIQPVGEGDNDIGHRGIDAVYPHRAGKRAVNLQHVRAQCFQPRQGAVAGAKVIDRQLDAFLVQIFGHVLVRTSRSVNSTTSCCTGFMLNQ